MLTPRQLFLLVSAWALQRALAQDSAHLWQDALAYHGWLSAFGTQNEPPCQVMDSAAMSVTLEPKGFHSNIVYTVKRSQFETFGQCRLSVLQPLPAGIYADPYELENLLNIRDNPHVSQLKLSAFKLFGPVDVEKIASDCNATVLSVSAQFKLPRQGVQSSNDLKHLHLFVPLHARYPAPQSQPITGTLSLILSAHYKYSVEAPLLMVQCAGATKAICYYLTQPQANANSDVQLQFSWIVPAGGVWHSQLVQYATAVTALCGLGVLLLTASFQHHHKQVKHIP